MKISVVDGPNVAVYPPGARFGPRSSRDWEFVWLLEGDALYRVQHGEFSQEIAVPEGHLLLCRVGTRDEFVWDQKRRTRHGFFHFELETPPDGLQVVASPVSDDSLPPAPSSTDAVVVGSPWVRSFSDHPLLEALCRHLMTLGGEDDAAQRDGAAGLLLQAFLSGQTQIGEATSRRVPDAVERALGWLYRRLEDDSAAPISLDALARAAFVTPEHLCRLFKTSTGRSPLETVRLARLDRAAVLLARSNYAVAQVARLSGFGSPFHFSRAFKTEYGVSPRALRENLALGAALPPPRLLRTLRPHAAPREVAARGEVEVDSPRARL